MKLGHVSELSPHPRTFTGSDHSPAIAAAPTATPARAPERDCGYEIVAAIARARLLHPAPYPAHPPRGRSW